MECQCLAPGEVPHTTRLYSAYLENDERVRQFFVHPPAWEAIATAASAAQIAPQTRSEVVAALRDQNRGFGVDASVESNLDRLAAGSAAIVTGQQVGLFTGPAYSLYKALTAIRVAREMTARGTSAVPVFWLASEDHDLEEVNHCLWPSADGLKRFALSGQGGEGRRVGDIALGVGIEALVAAATEILAGPSSAVVAEALSAAYRAAETYSGAFGKLLARLFAGRGLVLLDPLDIRLQRLATPIYRQALDQNEEIIGGLMTRGKALENAGYHAQVKVTERGTLLFAQVAGRRLPLRVKNGSFTAGEAAFSAADLEQALEAAPGFFSASVLLRPVVQDSLLPTAAYVAGPSELAYYAQASVVYSKLLGRMPVILPRAGFTLVEPEVGRLLRKYRLTVRDVLRGRQHLRARLERESVPRALDRQFSTGEKNLRRLLMRMRRPLKQLDPTLLGALGTAERKMLFQFDKLRGKTGRAGEERVALLDAREMTLRDALFPHRGMQERTHCLVPYLARHGMDLLDQLEERALPPGITGSALEKRTPGVHQVLFL
jgi:bacillithiol biosynthesis cysteine-adding enzyme BshC